MKLENEEESKVLLDNKDLMPDPSVLENQEKRKEFAHWIRCHHHILFLIIDQWKITELKEDLIKNGVGDNSKIWNFRKHLLQVKDFDHIPHVEWYEVCAVFIA
ncbi:isoleucine--tRNA ligase [Sesbania bispinosa]|nr:isoleucine--tRNA ligase [Sesbania bispinosa]